MSACRHRDGTLLWRHVNTMFPVEYVESYNFLLASVSFTLNLDVKATIQIHNGIRTAMLFLTSQEYLSKYLHIISY